MDFCVAWTVSALGLVILAWLIGRRTGQGTLGILIDHRGRYSLTHFQIVLWTIVILSSTIGVLIANKFDPASLALTPQLLGLMGISVGSAVFSTAVKGAKDDNTSIVIAAAGKQISDGAGNLRTVKPHFSQIWLEEEGERAEIVINITKFQNFIFTLIILSFYVAIACKTNGLPALPENVEWLIGISHAGYVGGKMPDRK